MALPIAHKNIVIGAMLVVDRKKTGKIGNPRTSVGRDECYSTRVINQSEKFWLVYINKTLMGGALLQLRCLACAEPIPQTSKHVFIRAR